MEAYLYGAIVFLHVVSAILSIGPLFILLPIIRRMRSVETDSEQAYLSVFYVIIRMVMHSGHVLVFTGVLLIIIGPWPWYTSWVVMTVIVMLLSAFFLARGFSIVLRKFHLPGVNKKNILDRLNRTSWLYIGLMLVMLWLMVQKPILW